jgi:hypothetical protein
MNGHLSHTLYNICCYWCSTSVATDCTLSGIQVIGVELISRTSLLITMLLFCTVLCGSLGVLCCEKVQKGGKKRKEGC